MLATQYYCKVQTGKEKYCLKIENSPPPSVSGGGGGARRNLNKMRHNKSTLRVELLSVAGAYHIYCDIKINVKAITSK